VRRRTAHRSLGRVDRRSRDHQAPPGRRACSCGRPASRRFDGTAGPRGRRANIASAGGAQGALGTAGGDEVDGAQAGPIDATTSGSDPRCAESHGRAALRPTFCAALFTKSGSAGVRTAATCAPLPDVDTGTALGSTVRRAAASGGSVAGSDCSWPNTPSTLGATFRSTAARRAPSPAFAPKAADRYCDDCDFRARAEVRRTERRRSETGNGLGRP